jgi:hypothetical protein
MSYYSTKFVCFQVYDIGMSLLTKYAFEIIKSELKHRKVKVE